MTTFRVLMLLSAIVVPLEAEAAQVRSKSGATASVAPSARGKFQCLINKLDTTGYRIDFMGGYRRTKIAGSNQWSKHASGLALDINQTARNRVTRRFPANINQMASSCGLFHGAKWGYPDTGHFEVR